MSEPPRNESAGPGPADQPEAAVPDDASFGTGADGAADDGADEADEADEAAATGAAPASDDSHPIDIEDLVADLERVSSERDEYLDSLRRLQAEFENYRKVVAKREADTRARANDALVTELLPVLDACDGALANGAEDVAPVRSALLDALAKQGLERLEPVESPFDPEQHEAVLHEEADDGNGPVVAEVLRVGYGWKGHVVRPAMVKVRG